MHPQRIRRVEVEVDEAAVDRAMPFVERLVADCGLLPATSSKFGAGLDASGLRAPGPPSFGDTSINPKMTAGELAMAVLRRHFAAFVANEPGTRLGDDIEPLHQMRVATRRIRAALRVFAPYLPGDAKRYRDEFSWVGGGLGPVRDLDVQLERVPRWRAALADPEASSLGQYEAHLGALREGARCRMFEVLNSPRYDELAAGFAALLQSQPPRTPRITVVAPALIAAEHRRLRKLGGRITPESAPGNYHRLRVAVKHLRYTLEFVEPAYGRLVSRAIKDAVALQDLLGLHQDADIAIDTVRSAATAPDTTFSPATILALGGVMEQYRGQILELRARFPRRYRSLTGDRWRRVVAHVEARA